MPRFFIEEMMDDSFDRYSVNSNIVNGIVRTVGAKSKLRVISVAYDVYLGDSSGAVNLCLLISLDRLTLLA